MIPIVQVKIARARLAKDAMPALIERLSVKAPLRRPRSHATDLWSGSIFFSTALSGNALVLERRQPVNATGKPFVSICDKAGR
jgi:hypothetical protein